MKKRVLLLGAWLAMGVTAFAQSGIIKGRVLDGNDPLPGVVVELKGTQKIATTDMSGTFTLTDVSPNEYQMVISYFGYENKTETIQVVSNEVHDLKAIQLAGAANDLDEIVVVASRRLSEAKALNMQKNAVGVINVIASDGIGKLPDRNAAETVQRVPGVSIERDQGEGRYVAVRGLPAEWSSTTMNGHRLPTAADEGASRATAFDFFPTDLIGYVEVAKALTPDIDGDALGGSVNFITKTAPNSFTLNANAGVGYNDKSGKGIYSGAVTVGDRSENGKFGFIVNLSQWNRNWAGDNFEARRSGDEGVYRLELRDYTGERRTTGLNAGFEFSPNANHQFYTRLNYGKLLDREIHYKHRIRFDKFNPATGMGRIEQQNIYNDLNFDFYAGEIGAKHFLKKGTLDWSLAHYSTEFKYGNIPDKQNHSYLSVMFTQDNVPFNGAMLEDRGVGPRAYLAEDGGSMTTSTVFDYLGDKNFVTDPTKMNFTNLQLYKVAVKERDNIVATVNYEVDTNDALKLKFGAKFTDKERIAKFSDEYYGWSVTGPKPTLSDYGQYTQYQPGRTDYMKEMHTDIGQSLGPVLSTEGMVQFYKDNFFNGNLSLLEGESEILANGGGLGRNFDVREQHASAYGMATYKIDKQWTVLGGLRATNTHTKVKGYTYDAETKTLSKAESTKSYLALLPMLHVKYQATENTNVRFAATRTFTRPDFGFLAPGGTYLAADNEYFGGNPDVDPTYAYNFDLMAEHYFGELDMVSAGVFYKKITDPIFVNAVQGTVNGIQGVEMVTPNNGDDAWLLGLEFSGNKRFDFLPGFLKNFGVQANYTFTKSEMKIPGRPGTTSLPRQGKHLINGQLYYEKGGFNARLAYNFKSKYIIEHGSSGQPKDDVYYGDYTSVDANVSFKISKHFTVFAEANNLLNQKLEYYYGNDSRPKQVEYYGVRGMIGLKWEF